MRDWPVKGKRLSSSGLRTGMWQVAPPSMRRPTTAEPRAPVPPVTTMCRPSKVRFMHKLRWVAYRGSRFCGGSMPLYEYICEQDGSVLELLRPMADADEPVKDPDGRGRTFKRKHSTFATGAGAAAGTSVLSRQRGADGCCPCGKPGGGVAGGGGPPGADRARPR